MKVELTFTEPLLGTLAGDKKLAEAHILSKHPNGPAEDEMLAETTDEEIEKHSTIFPRKNGVPFLWDYQIKGFFKDACRMMHDTECLTKEDLKKVRLTGYSYKRTIDNLIFPSPRKIMLQLPNGDTKLEFCERPLRADTRQGERIALARSEMAPAGTKIQFTILFLNKKLESFIQRWLDGGALRGLGQWRNSGMGRFSWEELKSE